MASNTITFNNNNTWTAPNNGVIMVECWGSGGGGGSTSSTTNAGGGGGGGAYARSNIQAVPGAVYNIVVGAAGAGNTGNNNGVVGGNTTFNKAGVGNMSVDIPLVRAAGGRNGLRSNAAGAGGSVANSYGDILFAGGSGGTGNSPANLGGGGGGAAGSLGIGGAGGCPTAGVGNTVGGGSGATGGSANANGGTDNTEPGGGGAGSGNNSGTPAKTSSAGKLGAVKISFNDNATASGKVTLDGANVAGAKVIVISSDDNDTTNAVIVATATSNAEGNWTATVPDNSVISAFAQHNNGTQYTSKATPFVPS